MSLKLANIVKAPECTHACTHVSRIPACSWGSWDEMEEGWYHLSPSWAQRVLLWKVRNVCGQHVKVWFGRRGMARWVVHLCRVSAVCERKTGLQVNTEGFLCKQQLFPKVVCTQKTRLCLENPVPECWDKSYWFWDGWACLKAKLFLQECHSADINRNKE